jgi:hypothetical protein
MQKTHMFLFILIASLGLLLVLFAASLFLESAAAAAYQSSLPQQLWGGMMNGMMNSTGYHSNIGHAAPSYLWIIPAGLIGFGAIGVIGLFFYMVFPEINTTAGLHDAGKGGFVSDVHSGDSSEQVANPGNPRNPYESVSKILTTEERKIMDILIVHQGKYLQKYIRKEAGFSRLKTHRIIARFAEREIVTLKPLGNTNEVVLSDWLQWSQVSKSA